jgi:hypothetical protein
MKVKNVAVVLALMVFAGAFQPGLRADDDRSGKHLSAKLKGFHETPAVSTTARGSFRATISSDQTEINFELTYSGLAADSLFAHIHLGQKDFPGGVMMFLCDNSDVPSSPRTCPARGGTVTGTLTAADVIGPTGQGIAPGEFGEVLRAIAREVTYVNVHSTMFPAGEIRGQIDDERHRHRDDDRHDH